MKPRPYQFPASELDQQCMDAVREILGMAPLYAAKKLPDPAAWLPRLPDRTKISDRISGVSKE